MQKIIIPACLSILLSACLGGFAPLESTRPMVSEGAESIPAAFAQFPDLPFPEKTEMDLTSSVLFGSGEMWTGKLVFAAPYNISSMFDFYMSEMPKFGWQEIAVVRSKISSMAYVRKDRAAIIQLEGSGSSTVTLVVTPRKDETSSSSGVPLRQPQ